MALIGRRHRNRPVPGRRRQSLTDPQAVLVREPSRFNALVRRRSAAAHHTLELLPIGFGVEPAILLLVVAKVLVRDGQREVVDLRHELLEELLALLVVGFQLDAPADQNARVRRFAVGRAVDRAQRPLLVRLRLTGRGEVHEDLHDERLGDAIVDIERDLTGPGRPVLIHAVDNDTAGAMDLEGLRASATLSGEVLRVAAELARDPARLRRRGLLSELQDTLPEPDLAPDDTALAAQLDRAARAVVELLDEDDA